VQIKPKNSTFKRRTETKSTAGYKAQIRHS